MPTVDFVMRSRVVVSERVRQVARMFDMPPDAGAMQRITAQVPHADAPWRLGAIIGPSGSGKSALAGRVFGQCAVALRPWPRDRAVIDGLGEHPPQRIAAVLKAMGLGSAPAWLRPYAALSTGERFRCDLARALLDGGDPVVVDEFATSVDRTTGRMVAMTLGRAVRRGVIGSRFVAATCYSHVLAWLRPDWVVDMATGELLWGWVQRRPTIQLVVARCGRAAWALFSTNHYLTGRLHRSARCYLASWGPRPVAFCATLAQAGVRRMRRITRLVVLPPFQGVGIGRRLAAVVAAIEAGDGYRMRLVTGHELFAKALGCDPRWRHVTTDRRRRPHRGALAGREGGHGGKAQRAQFTYAWVGQAVDSDMEMEDKVNDGGAVFGQDAAASRAAPAKGDRGMHGAVGAWAVG